MSKRRGHGEGAIYPRKNGGGWVGSVELGYADGKRKRKRIYGKTRKEVADKLKVLQRDQQQGKVVQSSKHTVASFLDTWLQQVVKPTVRYSTRKSYAEIVRQHLTPALGRHRLEKLTPLHVQALINQKLAAGLSPQTVHYMHAVLRNALAHAMKWELVGSNVATRVDPPRVPYYEMRFLSPADARKLLAAVKGDRLEGLYVVALALGLRQGESLGLSWEDIDFEARTLRVRHALQRVDGKLVLVEPKTARSRRTLTMPSLVIDALRQHRLRQEEERALAGGRWTESGLVFTTAIGTPLDSRNVTRRFKEVLEVAGLPDMRWHDLRHSCASFLLAGGIAPRVAMDVLGHSQIAVTMRYSHLIPELRAEAAATIERVITGE